MLSNCELALPDRQHLALLLAAHLVQARFRTCLALGEVPRPCHFTPDDLEKLLLMLQSSDVVLVPKRLVLQVGFESGHLGVALGEHEPNFAIVEGEQPVIQPHLLAIEHVDRTHVGRHRRGQMSDARGVDKSEEHELGHHRPRLDCRCSHRPGSLLGAERLTLGLALDQRRHAADSAARISTGNANRTIRGNMSFRTASPGHGCSTAREHGSATSAVC